MEVAKFLKEFRHGGVEFLIAGFDKKKRIEAVLVEEFLEGVGDESAEKEASEVGGCCGQPGEDEGWGWLGPSADENLLEVEDGWVRAKGEVGDGIGCMKRIAVVAKVGCELKVG